MRAAISSAAAALLGAFAIGCAGTIVRPSDIPPFPPRMPAGESSVVLLLEGVPEPMAEEVRSFAGSSGPAREAAALQPEAALRTACEAPGDLVLRPRLLRTHFVSNAPDRNTLFIYETAIIIGIPVTLVSAIVWKYYAETLAESQLEMLACAEAGPSRHIASFRLRSEGRGFVRTNTLQDAQYDAALRGATRNVIAVALRWRLRKEETADE